MTPVAACQGQGIEQPWHSLIEDGTIVAARLVAERTGKPTFARTGRAADQQALVPSDPVAGCKRRRQNPSVKRPDIPVAPEQKSGSG